MTSSPAGGFQIRVDLNRCQGYAQCCYAAPDLFSLRGHETLFFDPSPAEAARAVLERARVACPVQAIRFERRVVLRR